MNQHKMSVIKTEFDDNSTTQLEGWSVVTGDTISPVTNSTPPLSTRATQSVSNQPSPPSTTSTTSTSRSSHVEQTYAGVAYVRANPPYARQGQVKNVERNNNNNRPFISTRNNKFVPIGSNVQQTTTKLPYNFELQLKQTQEKLKEMTDKYEVLEKKYDQLRLDHLELKTNSNKSIEELKLDNAKLNEKLNQTADYQVALMAQISAQTPTEMIQASAQFDIKDEIDDDISTRPVQLHNMIQVSQNDDSEHSLSPSNGTEMQIKQEFSDDDSSSNQVIDILSGDQPNTNSNSVSQCITTANEHVSPSANEQIDVINNFTDESDQHELIGANVVLQSTQMLQSNDAQANMNEVVNGDNVLVDEDKGNTDLNNDEEMSNNGRSVVESNEPSTSSQQHSNLIASTLPTGSNHQNLTKRKRKSQSNCSMKRSNKTVEDEDEGEEEADIAYNNRVNDKIKMLYLDCTEQNCEIKFNSVYRFQDHLRTAHGILPYRCFALNCISRFNNCQLLGDHIKLQHSKSTKFECHACHNGFASQKEASNHWNHIHLTGQFQCKLNECYQVLDTRSKVHAHQRYKHCPESKRFQCQHDGCEASFVTKHNLKRHGMSHANTKPFNCTWTECGFRSNDRPHMVRHIRMRHFGLPETLKEQAAKNIVDERDPNEYVRVVDR